MSPMLIARLVGGGLLAAGLLIAVLDWRSARSARAELKQCVAAAKDQAKPLDGCQDHVAAAILSARRAAACDVAIDAIDLYGQRMACSAPVKRQGAERDAAIAERDDARAQLADAERRTTAAIARAEARGTTLAQRTRDADATISRLPAGDGGLRTCDADCLRRITGATDGG